MKQIVYNIKEVNPDETIYAEPRPINPALLETWGNAVLQASEIKPEPVSIYVKNPDAPVISQTPTLIPIKGEPVSLLGTPMVNPETGEITYDGGSLNNVTIPKKTQFKKTMEKLKTFYTSYKTYCNIGIAVVVVILGYLALKPKK